MSLQNPDVLTPSRCTRSRRKTIDVEIVENITPRQSSTRKKRIKEVYSEVKKEKVQEKTPRKQKSSTTEQDLQLQSPVTPPKQARTYENFLKSPTTPSTLLNRLTLNSPNKIIEKKDEENCFTPKSLFENKTIYQSARKALHSTVPTTMPGREKELGELRAFITENLEEEKSGTMYISGPPGTGKTAALTTILHDPKFSGRFQKVYVNCTSIKSSGAIFARIVDELNIRAHGRSEKDNMLAIENYLKKSHKMIFLVLDEIDQLESKNQSILYTIFEWPAKPNSRTILVGIANALDLTDRTLPRLQVRCDLKPKLMHFAPYSKQQIIHIFTERLKEAGVLEVFTPVALQMLAGKVASISGDLRRALDIGRRVIELVEQDKKTDVLKSLENFEEKKSAVELKQVVNVLNNVYGTSNNLKEDDADDTFPLQQKIILCTLLLILQKARNKDVTIGRLHEIYRKVCAKRNISAVDQSEFVGLCSLIETRGIIRVAGKKEVRMHKVNLQWDREEVTSVLNDKQLLSAILQDDQCLGKL